MTFSSLALFLTLTAALPRERGNFDVAIARENPVQFSNPNVISLQRRRVVPRKRQFARRNEDDLTLSDGNQEYLAQLTIGSPLKPQQTFYLPVDTGSSDTWVAGVGFLCENGHGCQPSSLFKPGASFTRLDATLRNEYGDGSILGTLGTDTLTLAGISVFNATIGVVYQAAWRFNGVTSGLLGLGGAALSSIWYRGDSESTFYDPLFVQMYKSGLAPANFTLALGPEKGYLAFGGVPDVAHNSYWAVSPMPPYSSDLANGTIYGYYFAAVDRVELSNLLGGTDSTTEQIRYLDWMMVDSGTSANILPADIANALNDVWDPPPDSEGFIPCDLSAFSAIPKLGITIGGFTFYHSPESLISQYPEGGCGSAILPAGSDDPIILGTPFLQNAVVTFDIANQIMMLASTNPNQLK